MMGNTRALIDAMKYLAEQEIPIDLPLIVAVREAVADGHYPVSLLEIREEIVHPDLPKNNLA